MTNQTRNITSIFIVTQVSSSMSLVKFRKVIFLLRRTKSEITAILIFRHRASCILGKAFHCTPEKAFYIFNQQIYFII